MKETQRVLREALAGILYPFEPIIEVREGYLLLIRRGEDHTGVYWLKVSELRYMDEREFSFFVRTCEDTWDDEPTSNAAKRSVNEVVTMPVRAKPFYVKAAKDGDEYTPVLVGGRCMRDLLPLILEVRKAVVKDPSVERVFRMVTTRRVSSRSTRPRAK